MSAIRQHPARPARGTAEFGTVLAEGFAARVGALALRFGADRPTVQWVRRAAFAASRATSDGHVCISLAALARRYGASFAEAFAALRASGVVSDGSEPASQLKPLVIDDAGRLYLARYYDYERRLADAIVAHAISCGNATHLLAHGGSSSVQALPDSAALEARIARYFGPPSGGEIDWQRAAAALALGGRLTVVSGGPGTGKTTTVVGILACLLDAQPTLSIALAAPTGKAAQRMQEALAARASALPGEIAALLPRTSQTLHRLLGIARGTRARHDRDNPLPYDVVVIDEASMIDVAMASQLFDAIGPDTRLVLLGDKDQLAAVEAGAVFAEISARPAFSARGIERIARATALEQQQVAAMLAQIEIDQTASADADGEMAGQSDVAGDVQPYDDDAWYIDAYEAAGFDAFEASGVPDRQLPVPGREHATTNGAPPSASAAERRVPINGEAQRGEAPMQGELFAAPLPDPVEQARCAAACDEAPLVDSVIWLERNYRFGLESAIGRLSMAIRRGDVPAALAALAPAGREDAPAVLDEQAGATLSHDAIERLAAGFAPYAAALARALAQPTPDPVPLFDALNGFRVLCATRVGARGVDALNGVIAAQVRHAARVPLGVGASWFAGRPVMIARNDYALGLFNGDIGVALPGPGGALRVYFRTADGAVRAVTPAALPPHDTAFALTVHKSQGSEFDAATLVLPATLSRVLSRELVYTAVTRARHTVRIVGAAAILAAAIATPTRRDSGLALRMAEARRRLDARE
jgi:exodeoxyribonuclease V alpha subunit